MFEDLFDFSDKLISEEETSSGLITFEEYLSNKNDDGTGDSFNSFGLDDTFTVTESVGMMTFLEYLETKNISVVVVEDEEISSIIKPSIPIESQTDQNVPTEKTSVKSLWDGYIQQVNNQSKNRSYVNIQDPAYLSESRIAYSAAMIEEQKKVYDQLYFFTGGGNYIEEPEEEVCAIIGKAIIGKNKIC
jgi:hypothetical protein